MLPAWSAVIVQVPAARMVVVLPAREQVAGVVLAKMIALLEAPPVALSVYVPPFEYAIGVTGVKPVMV